VAAPMYSKRNRIPNWWWW